MGDRALDAHNVIAAKRFIPVVLLHCAFIGLAELNAQVRLVAAINTEVTGAGIDARRIKKTLATGLGNRFQVDTEFTGDSISRRAVLTHYARLRSNVDETLIFFYVGHGFTDRDEHFLDIGDEPLARSDLRNEMQRTGAGLVVILTDTCSRRDSFNGRLSNGLPPDYAVYGSEQPSNSRWAKTGFSQLFMKSRGLVDINASTYDPETGGELSWGDRTHGGLFTNTFCRLLLSRFDAIDAPQQDGLVTWGEVYMRLRKQMRSNFQHMKKFLSKTGGLSTAERERLHESTTQTPQTWSLVDEQDRLEMITKWDGRSMIVDEVFRRGAADEGGLRSGDIIVELDGRRIRSEVDYLRQIHFVPSGSLVRFTVRGRDGRIGECRVRVVE